MWNKLDSPLTEMFMDFEASGRDPSADEKLLISLFYRGPLEELERLGFEVAFRGPEGYATGEVSLSALQALAEHEGVVRMSYGQEPEPLLDDSVPQINARDDVWTFASGAFTGTTGQGVIVGVVDTGIDWRHPFFLSQTTPTKESRILAIWDQGLRPEGGESAPDLALLSGEAGSATYGVEYSKAHIETALNGGTAVRHRDCDGHGTHVASIAAGNGREAGTYIGVAPEADLIVVKLLKLFHETRKNNDPAQGKVGYNVRFRDAVAYILNKAAALPDNKPVVINVSLGSPMGPHDGLTPNEDWLEHEFDARAKACLVTSAGNSGSKNTHAQLTFTGAGDIEVPFWIYDDRTVRTDYEECANRSNTRTSLSIQIYYDAGDGPIEVELDPGDGGGFVAGPARGAPPVEVSYEGHKATITHKLENQPLNFTGRPAVERSKVEISTKPVRDAFRLGNDYKLKVTAPGALTAYLWCSKGLRHGIRFLAEDPPVLRKPDTHLIGYYGGASHVVTVASYNAERSALPVARGSSRGPLVSYTATAPPPKPDLGAPGVGVDAAASKETAKKKKDRKTIGSTVRMGGTSMASPHVAGVVALMLEKNPTLTSTQILALLRDHGRDAVPAAEENELGRGRLNARAAIDATPAP